MLKVSLCYAITVSNFDHFTVKSFSQLFKKSLKKSEENGKNAENNFFLCFIFLSENNRRLTDNISSTAEK